MKSFISNTCHTIRNVDARERIAIGKSISPNTCHAIRNIYVTEKTTAEKRAFPNTCHTIGYANTFKIVTILKSPVPNYFHSFSDNVLVSQIFWCSEQSFPILTIFHAELVLYGILKILIRHFCAPHFLFLRFLHAEQSEGAHRQVLFGVGQQEHRQEGLHLLVDQQVLQGGESLARAQVEIVGGREQEAVGRAILLKQRRIKGDGLEREGNGSQGEIIDGFVEIVMVRKGCEKSFVPIVGDF